MKTKALELNEYDSVIYDPEDLGIVAWFLWSGFMKDWVEIPLERVSSTAYDKAKERIHEIESPESRREAKVDADLDAMNDEHWAINAIKSGLRPF